MVRILRQASTRRLESDSRPRLPGDLRRRQSTRGLFVRFGSPACFNTRASSARSRLCCAAEGAGKGIFFNWIVRGWGQHGIHITHAKHLIGNFNAHLRNCVALFADEAFWPRKSAGALRPRPPSLLDGGFGLTLLIDAQAWISVPSTEKCSLDNNRFNRGCDSTAARNLAAISPFPTVGRGSSKSSNGPIPDHRCRGRRTSGTAGQTRSAPSAAAPSEPNRGPATAIARSNFSGGTDGRPMPE